MKFNRFHGTDIAISLKEIIFKEEK